MTSARHISANLMPYRTCRASIDTGARMFSQIAATVATFNPLPGRPTPPPRRRRHPLPEPRPGRVPSHVSHPCRPSRVSLRGEHVEDVAERCDVLRQSTHPCAEFVLAARPSLMSTPADGEDTYAARCGGSTRTTQKPIVKQAGVGPRCSVRFGSWSRAPPPRIGWARSWWLRLDACVAPIRDLHQGCAHPAEPVAALPVLTRVAED